MRRSNRGITEADVPAEFNGRPVVSIGENAFEFAMLRSITLPGSIRTLGANVFWYCMSLAGVKLPKGICRIPKAAFENCRSLKSVDIPEGVTEICEDAFAGCTSLEEVVLPKSLRTLGAAFTGCTSLRSVVFRSKGVYVAPCTFDDCPALPAETAMRALVPGDDITAPFRPDACEEKYILTFKGAAALRRDVFELAIKYDSFSRVNKTVIFRALFSENLFAVYFPIMISNGWLYRPENAAAFAEELSHILFRDMMYTFDFDDEDPPGLWENMEIWATDEKLLDGIIAAENKDMFNEAVFEFSPAYRGQTEAAAVFFDALLENSAAYGQTEATAALLEYKNKKFGFGMEVKYEL